MITNNFENIQMISQPKQIKVPLFQHQLASIYQMEKRESEQKVVNNNSVIETNISVYADKTGYGKCHGRDTPIIMFDGTVKMVQDIKSGELLMGDDSTPRKVLSLARGKEQLYKISQIIGEDYIVNESHILSLQMTCPKYISKQKNRIQVLWFEPKSLIFKSINFNYQTYNYDKDKTLEDAKKYLISIPNIDTRIDICLKDYINLPKKIQKHLKGYKSDIDCWENELNEKDVDPYYIGLALSYNNQTTYQKIINYLYPDNITNILNKYNLMNNKHIPYKYKINTRENRLRLLAGIIDRDSYYNEGVYGIIQKNDQLSKDIVFLCQSLGFKCVVKKIDKSCYIRIIISGSKLYEIPVLIQTKSKILKYNKNQLCTNIKVESVNIGEYYGFSIDNNHRYLLGDFTVTHNTLAMITLIHRDKMNWDISSPYKQSIVTTYADGRIKKTVTNDYEKNDVTLVLVSQSIIHQWYDECQKTPLSVKMITSKQHIDTVMIDNYDIILVTPTMYNRLVSKYFRIAWKRFIFDEPGHLKIPAMNKIIAGFIWLVTATPDAIIAQHKNCRNSFMHDIICFAGWGPFSVYFDYMIIKNDDTFIEQSFRMPPTNHIYYKCYNPIYNTVNGFVTNNITQMISAGNIQGAIKALGGGETQNITELVKQKKLSERDELESILSIYKLKNKKKKIDIVSEKIQRIDIQIKELTNRYEEILKGDCSICFSPISNPTMEPNCQNIFCGECLLKWISTKITCPLCRDNIQTKELIYINTKTETESEYKNKQVHKNSDQTQIHTKINTIINLLKSNHNGKFIIFSGWDQTFGPIRTHLLKHNISFIEVKGSVNERMNNITSFKEGNTQVIFLNSRFNGAGINLQEATDIIVYHEMEPTTLNQIIGRANRIGRTESLNVHHLQI